MSEDKEKLLERLELFNEVASNIALLLTIFVFTVFSAQLLGINVNYILYLIVTFKWYIPKWLLEKYFGVFYAMAWALLLLMLWDSIYQNLYTRRHGEPNAKYAYYSSIIMFLYTRRHGEPNAKYAYYSSIIMFVLSFTLSIAFHVWLFYFLAFTSAFTFLYILVGPTGSTGGGASW